ncbi:MAG: glycoside hydrolase family 5 protein [Lachnospiraceae bacterium]|nr:glycoside hydrolase family 5 protein [Lachnospiraceae bacterium]
MTSVCFANNLKLGWNLGNTLEAYITGKVFEDDLEAENSWGNPTTTKEMIDFLKSRGFNLIRIPVSWHPHLEDPDITDGSEIKIRQAWLNRVKEVVDYCIDDDLYVIINIHHDNEKEYYYPDMEHKEQSLRYVKEIWTTVAEFFKDYDEHLIFESLNEPRLVGTIYEWKMNFLAKDCLNAEQIINESNQLFVDTVRSTGGNNSNRYLLIPGYDASSISIQSKNFLIPTDSAKDKLLIEVHAYVPYDFALQELSTTESNKYFDPEKYSSTYTIDDLGKMLDEKFLSKGIGVVVDEFGARNKNGNNKDRAAYYDYFIKTMAGYGIPCVVWDNGNGFSEGEQFGLLNRRELSWYYPEVAQSIENAGKEGYGD